MDIIREGRWSKKNSSTNLASLPNLMVVDWFIGYKPTTNVCFWVGQSDMREQFTQASFLTFTSFLGGCRGVFPPLIWRCIICQHPAKLNLINAVRNARLAPAPQRSQGRIITAILWRASEVLCFYFGINKTLMIFPQNCFHHINPAWAGQV